MGPEEQQYDPILAQYEQERLQNEQEIRELTAEVAFMRATLKDCSWPKTKKGLNACPICGGTRSHVVACRFKKCLDNTTGTDLLAKVERYENVYKTLRAILEDHKRMGTEYTQDYYIEKLLDEAIDAGKESK
jgi:recombinational DNA repair protein RecR